MRWKKFNTRILVLNFAGRRTIRKWMKKFLFESFAQILVLVFVSNACRIQGFSPGEILLKGKVGLVFSEIKTKNSARSNSSSLTNQKITASV